MDDDGDTRHGALIMFAAGGGDTVFAPSDCRVVTVCGKYADCRVVTVCGKYADRRQEKLVIALMAPCAIERQSASARRSDDARVKEYLRTGCIDELREDDPGGHATHALLGDPDLPWFVLPGTAARLERILAGCTPVARIVCAHAVLRVRDGQSIHTMLDASLVCLPDGRLVCVPSAHEAVPNPAYRLSSSVGPAWMTKREPFLYLDDTADRLAARSDYLRDRGALMRRLTDDARPPWRVLADTTPSDTAPRVRELLCAHARLLSSRRRAAAAIGRAWCRYDGAPHGPRGRYLRDLDHGWTPPGTNTVTDTDTPTPRPEASTRCETTMALFADAAAYRAYDSERVAALRPLLRKERADTATRVRLRLAALCELPGGRAEKTDS